MTKDEITRLNKVGAMKIRDKVFISSGVWWLYECNIPFSPTTDLNHTRMVADTYPIWEVCKTVEGNYRAIVWPKYDPYHVNPVHYTARADDPAQAIMLAIEGAEKGERYGRI